jgi:sugar phosphate isomerase/epimerase
VYLEDQEPDKTMASVRDMGFDLCEIYTNQVDRNAAERCRRAMEKHRVEASALFTSGLGRMVWTLLDGPDTLGLVPRTDRTARVAALKLASDFAKICGISAFETHVGFIPENPRDPLYRETVDACREVAAHCRANGQTFLYHAGQETPLTLLRTIQDVGLDNQGVGLDTSNLILLRQRPSDRRAGDLRQTPQGGERQGWLVAHRPRSVRPGNPAGRGTRGLSPVHEAAGGNRLPRPDHHRARKRRGIFPRRSPQGAALP